MPPKVTRRLTRSQTKAKRDAVAAKVKAKEERAKTKRLEKIQKDKARKLERKTRKLEREREKELGVKAPKKTKKVRISKLAQCIRKTSATTRISRKYMPDSPSFDTSVFVPEMSGKFTRLIEKIKELDAIDMRDHGTMFKHFIFTDIRESAYGAKALAAFMIAAGFDLRMGVKGKQVKRKGKLVETKTGETVYKAKEAVEGGSNGFAMLQSLPLWKNALSTTTKKEILKVFNSRPENVHGEQLRIIILDSKFKEGIDLFDVKYVHLLEPAIATSDLKQAVGRATRFCGQKGLPFAPRRGWPLEVYIYSTVLPGRKPFILGDEQKIDAHDLMLAKSGLDLAMLNLTKELTILGIASAVDYDLNFKINNFNIESALLEATEIEDVVIAEVAEDKQSGGKRVISILKPEDITPARLAKCQHGRKSKLFPFTNQHLLRVAKRMGLPIPKGAKRDVFCSMLKNEPGYLEAMLRPQTPKQAKSISSIARTLGSVADRDSPVADYLTSPMYADAADDANRNKALDGLRSLFKTPKTPSIASTVGTVGTVGSPDSLSPIANYLQSRKQSSAENRAADEALLLVRDLFVTPKTPSPKVVSKKDAQDVLKTLKDASFDDFQKEIINLYKKFKWASPVVKNGCDAVQAGKPGTAVSFTQTQDFVRHYLTPNSPFKGLLAWHSVGTGKTCMAVAAATTQFEQAGYTILWVTRNALMADVYKNIFGSVCSIPIMEKLEQGTKLPTDLAKQKRMLSRAWLQPISYRTFQNALQKKNELGRMLYAKNATDPLHKTFLIMDEVHKLQDGDLSAAEAADFGTIQKYIHASYDKSGDESVRPLLMTATPITDSPQELFEILNTLIPEKEKRFVPFQDYREQYTNEKGEISETGRKYFQERAKGLISYLNREFDPTTFSQPVFHTVSVPVGEAIVPAVEALVDKCLEGADLDEMIAEEVEEQDCNALDAELDAELARIEASNLPKKEKKSNSSELKKTYKLKKKECVKGNKTAAKAAVKTRKAAAKGILASAKKCYAAQKKAFNKTRKVSQMAAVEGCFKEKGVKGEKVAYADRKEFVAALQKRMTRKSPKSIRSVNAVRTPIH